MHPDDEPLLDEITIALEIDHQYRRLVEVWNQELVDRIRHCGRAAGRRLGYRVRTFATDPDRRDDQRVIVWVGVTASTPEDQDRISERSQLLIEHALKGPFR